MTGVAWDRARAFRAEAGTWPSIEEGILDMPVLSPGNLEWLADLLDVVDQATLAMGQKLGLLGPSARASSEFQVQLRLAAAMQRRRMGDGAQAGEAPVGDRPGDHP